MAKKPQVIFVCQECGNESPKWMGQCICGKWNTMVEERVIDTAPDDRRRGVSGEKAKAVRIRDVKSGEHDRLDTGIPELNRVLGGGLVRGSLTLISGEPGIGKSTLIIQTAAKLAGKVGRVLYVTGEESEEQIKIRADRVCDVQPEELFLLAETNIDAIMEVEKEISPSFLVIDSIQTMYSGEITSAPGSVSQVRICANELMRIGKTKNIPVFIVAHVTKSGDLAGPKIIEHLVDCVLNFTGERDQEIRILRSYKNRFGTTSEIGAFEMKEEGLVEIQNLSGNFLDGMEHESEGSMATAIYEGTRPLLMEVQALTAATNIGFARRAAIGVDLGRLNMIIAVLDRKAGVSLINQDVYVNIVGGLKPEGTTVDLAVALAIYSASKGIKGSEKTLAIGEIGLTGDLRSIQNADRIIREAARLGFKKVILPLKNAEKIQDAPKGLQIKGVRNLRDAIWEQFNL
jgi:DNA repair protein RadA/Sms